MNGEQQRQHKAVTDEIRRTLAEFMEDTAERFDRNALEVAVLDRIAQRTTERADNLLRAVSDLRADHDSTAAQAGATDAVMGAFLTRGFWGRLKWLVLGR